jgi:hypothetical protein
LRNLIQIKKPAGLAGFSNITFPGLYSTGASGAAGAAGASGVAGASGTAGASTAGASGAATPGSTAGILPPQEAISITITLAKTKRAFFISIPPVLLL